MPPVPFLNFLCSTSSDRETGSHWKAHRCLPGNLDALALVLRAGSLDIISLLCLSVGMTQWKKTGQPSPMHLMPAGEVPTTQKSWVLSSADLEALLESSDDAIFSKDLNNIITQWSRGAEEVYGYSRQEMVGQSVTRLLPPECPDEAVLILEQIKRGERLERKETMRLTKDGKLLSVLLTVSPLRDTSGIIIGALTVARDITGRRQIEETVRHLEAQVESRALVMETANRIALNILAHRTGVEALRHIADAARTLACAKYAALGVARPGGGGLTEFVTVGLTEAEEAVIGARPKGTGILELLLERTEPLRIAMLGEHPASVGFPPNHPPMGSFLGVPIRRGDTVLGSLYLTDKEGGLPFTEDDEIAVEALGAYAAVAIHITEMLVRQRTLVSGLIHAQEEERRAVAYDLHDGLTQFVMAAHAHLEGFRSAHASGKEEKARCDLDQGLRYLKEAVIESRRLVNGLRTLALDDLGLAGALEEAVADEKGRAGWADADFVHNIAGRRFDKSLETAVYRVAQEALTNARKHAQTQRIHVLLLEEKESQSDYRHLLLEVRDWGIGFDRDQVLNAAEHVGMQSMIERIRLMEGSFEIQGKLGEGAAVRAVFPVTAADRKTDNDRKDDA